MNSQNWQKFFLGFFLSVGLLIFCVSPCLAVDDKYGFDATARQTDLPSLTMSNSSPEEVAQQVVQRGLLFVGTIFFLVMLYGGFIWLTARGQSQKVESAKQILETAIIGVIIVSASYAVSTYVFNRLTGSNNSASEATQ